MLHQLSFFLALAWVTTATGPTPIELSPVGLIPGESFGIGLATSTQVCAASSSTSVFVFQNEAGQWSQAVHVPFCKELTDECRPAPVPAIDVQRLVLGLRRESTVAKNNGAVVTLSLKDGQWTNQRMLHPPVQDAGLQFGWSVCLSGKTCAVGAPGYSATVPFGGCVYLLKESADGSWEIDARLEAPTARPQEGIGANLALLGDWCVATGMRLDSDRRKTDHDPAYIFHRADGVWSFHSQFVPAQAGGKGLLSEYPVAMSGDRLVIGGHRGPNGREVHIARLQDGAWVEEANLAHLPVDQRSLFGAALAIRDDVLAVGAPPNAVYWYRRSGESWVLKERLAAVKAGLDAQEFGATVAISGDCLLVGAPNTNKPLDGGGSLYVYKLNGDSGK